MFVVDKTPGKSPKDTGPSGATLMPDVEIEVEDATCVVSLNRPEKLNAISDEMYEALIHFLDSSIAEPAIRVILLRGEGRSFSSGRDTTEMGRNARSSNFLLGQHAQRLNSLIFNSPKPVIASLHGHVIGKALEMVLAADFRIADRSVLLSFPEVAHGLVTDNAGATLATMIAGASRAKRLLMTGQGVDCEKALSWGLIDELVDVGDLETESRGFARMIGQHDPLVLALAKQLVNEVASNAVSVGFRQEMLAQRLLLSNRDAAAPPPQT